MCAAYPRLHASAATCASDSAERMTDCQDGFNIRLQTLALWCAPTREPPYVGSGSQRRTRSCPAYGCFACRRVTLRCGPIGEHAFLARVNRKSASQTDFNLFESALPRSVPGEAYASTNSICESARLPRELRELLPMWRLEQQPLRSGEQIERGCRCSCNYCRESGSSFPVKGSHETLGCQFTNAPLGLSCHANV
jgi:hypothetical protein